jgi:Ankyrin repeat
MLMCFCGLLHGVLLAVQALLIAVARVSSTVKDAAAVDSAVSDGDSTRHGGQAAAMALDTVSWLLQAGADRAADRNGVNKANAFMVAASVRSNTAVLRLLLSECDAVTSATDGAAADEAVEANSMASTAATAISDGVRRRIDAALSMTNMLGCTALHCAAKNADAEAVELLVQAGVDAK